VAEPDQVLRRPSRRVGVVADHDVGAGIGDHAVEGDDRDAEVEERLEPGAAAVGGRHDHPEHAFVGEHLQVRALFLNGLVGVAEEHAVAGAEGGVLEDADGLAEVRILDVGNDHADRLCLLQAEVPRQSVRPVVDLGDGVEHAAAMLLPHLERAVQHARDGRGRDLRELGDMADVRRRAGREQALAATAARTV
jgi:hypothetical protein